MQSRPALVGSEYVETERSGDMGHDHALGGSDRSCDPRYSGIGSGEDQEVEPFRDACQFVITPKGAFDLPAGRSER